MQSGLNMSREELDMWTAKLKLYCVLHGTSLEKYRKDKNTFMKKICPLCILHKNNMCLRTPRPSTLWIDGVGVVIETTRDELAGLSDGRSCVEWIKHV